MATHNSTGQPPSFLVSQSVSKFPIQPALVRGQLYFQVAEVLFPTFAEAATAWSAAESHRLDIVDQVDRLTIERAVALTEMRTAGDDLLRFRAASKREAFLAAQIRQLREVAP